MIKIEFEDTVINVPESWKDIKLADYEKWYLKQPETKTDYIRFVADICKIDDMLLMESPTSLFDVIINTVNFVFNNNIVPNNKITIDGQEYFVSHGNKLTLGEWVDVESVLNSDNEQKLSEILAILCRPIGENYTPELLEKRQEIFRNQSCEKTLPLIAFFLHKKSELDKISNRYSEAIILANQFVLDTEDFVINGDGIKQLPIWQRIRFTYLMKSLKKQLSKFSDSSFIV